MKSGPQTFWACSDFSPFLCSRGVRVLKIASRSRKRNTPPHRNGTLTSFSIIILQKITPGTLGTPGTTYCRLTGTPGTIRSITKDRASGSSITLKGETPPSIMKGNGEKINLKRKKVAPGATKRMANAGGSSTPKDGRQPRLEEPVIEQPGTQKLSDERK